MLVVSDASSFIALINAGYLEILPSLYGQVIIPPAVETELRKPNKPALVRQFIGSLPEWLTIRSPRTVEQIEKLHSGEKEAIALAREIGASLLLIDERDAFHAAIVRGLNATGTVGVLIQAARRELLDLEQAFDALKRTNFWISHQLLDYELELFRRERAGTPQTEENLPRLD